MSYPVRRIIVHLCWARIYVWRPAGRLVQRVLHSKVDDLTIIIHEPLNRSNQPDTMNEPPQQSSAYWSLLFEILLQQQYSRAIGIYQ